jgi:hypothetical protein
MIIKERFDQLLWDACVTYGNCGSGDLHIRDLLPRSGKLTAEEFARLMLRAEKMTELRYGQQYRDNYGWCVARFKQTMDAESIDASEIWD